MTGSPRYIIGLRAALVAFATGCEQNASPADAIGVKNLSSSDCAKDDAGTPKDARCVISQRDGKTLSLQVFGLETLCLAPEVLEDVPWRAVASEDASGRVVVSVTWPSDKTPACGSCAYDFKLDLGPREWADTTEIKFEVRSCPGCGVDDARSVSLGTKSDERAMYACGDGQLAAGAP